MISAFDVYLVMQLGSIKSALCGLEILSVIFIAALCFVSFLLLSSKDTLPPFIFKGLRWAFGTLVASLSINAFTPTPQTAAAMYLLPTLTSPEVVSELKPEAKELYQLAKDALRGLATGEEPKPEKD